MPCFLEALKYIKISSYSTGSFETPGTHLSKPKADVVVSEAFGLRGHERGSESFSSSAPIRVANEAVAVALGRNGVCFFVFGGLGRIRKLLNRATFRTLGGESLDVFNLFQAHFKWFAG